MNMKSILNQTLETLKEKGVCADNLRKITAPSELITQLISTLANLSGDYKGSYSPAPDYQGLLRQFNALQQLNVSFGKQLTFYREKAKQGRDNPAELKRLQDEVNSERGANEQLTAENERLRAERLEADAETERLKALVLTLGGNPEAWERKAP
ncbi:hypothetical protein OSB94_14570 [Proteus vulgaris]|uniref:Uncharacterized protein n=2 Tax=Morganellaceae TaxID=1903414 RepID=A0AAE4FFA2_MORMO|nr:MULTISPECIES: hypothetical protein [Morganellaceae]MDI9094973.1 hypothetical protein [Providencia rettgeri]MDS0789316.1 hypothetical protein [Proteus vulgaris]MDS0899929.1 hypothetical protein [Morganella morganii]MDS0908837.1 hypothetical protein [Morganella morganii]MDT2035131.1 hypothetical protein [Providencia rettgeri]